ncbi:hypothetical protein PYCCODRAFT_127355 [Trametes coccinea BRFM310]|uniref:Myb-like domain-containing protein n=1 Tax=Trametes coccinea (strain BRFM310) TaxID=1353009 RepID=A0A1Y2IW34_TRAC3|nr:hypothetical protein PYCCODRAFT_127355 [Trametes coccinea BRFM310]
MNNIDPSRMFSPELAGLLAAAIGSAAGTPAPQMQTQPSTQSHTPGQFSPAPPAGSAAQMGPFPSLPSHNNAPSQWQPQPNAPYWQLQQSPPSSLGSSFLVPATPQARFQQSPQQSHQLAWGQQFQATNQSVGIPPGAGAGPVEPMNNIAPLLSVLQLYLAQQQATSQQQQQQQQQQHYPQPQPSPQSQTLPQPPLQPHAQPSLSPVGTSADDEDLIVRALKHCKARGITPRQALERLDGVNGHNASAWKDYFLDHLERLYGRAAPKVPPNGVARDASAPKASPFPLTASSTPPPLVQKRPTIPRSANRAPLPESAPVPKIMQGKPASSPPVPLEYARLSPEREVTTATSSAARRKRGGPVPVFHAGVLVPNSPAQMKPKPPLSDEADGCKFTDADKVFFIHYLRWRIRNKPTVSKSELYEELAAQIPRHDAEAWKRHWDKYPEVADQVYIEGRARARSPSPPSSSATAASGPSQTKHVDSCEDESDHWAPPSDEDGEGPSDKPDVAPASRQKRARRGRPWQRVTEEDLRAMAQYKAERYGPAWRNTVRTTRWQEFADRPENAKRTVLAWATIEGTHGGSRTSKLCHGVHAHTSHIQCHNDAAGERASRASTRRPEGSEDGGGDQSCRLVERAQYPLA